MPSEVFWDHDALPFPAVTASIRANPTLPQQQAPSYAIFLVTERQATANHSAKYLKNLHGTYTCAVSKRNHRGSPLISYGDWDEHVFHPGLRGN